MPEGNGNGAAARGRAWQVPGRQTQGDRLTQHFCSRGTDPGKMGTRATEKPICEQSEQHGSRWPKTRHNPHVHWLVDKMRSLQTTECGSARRRDGALAPAATWMAFGNRTLGDRRHTPKATWCRIPSVGNGRRDKSMETGSRSAVAWG